MGSETDRLASLIAAALAVTAGAVLALLWITGSPAALAAGFGLVPAALTALVAAFDTALARRIDDERAAAESSPEHRLFGDEALFLDAQRARQQFERFLVPACCVGLFAIEAWAAQRLWLHDGSGAANRALFTAALLAGTAFAAYVAGRVIAALAEQRGVPVWQPPADWLLFVAGAGAIAGVAVLLGRDTYPAAESLVTRLAAVAYGLTAVDQLVTLVLEIYRARTVGGAERAVYESRFIHLAVHPRGLVDNVARTLDYQFGWQISRTQLYASLENAVAPLLVFQLTALWLLSGVIVLEPAEEGLRERFGRPLEQPVIGPGLHLVWPWPIERIRRYPSRRLQYLDVGETGHGDEVPRRVVAWSEAHGHEHVPFVIAGAEDEPAGLVSTSIAVQYKVGDLRRFLYGFADGEALLSDLAWRETTRWFAGVDPTVAMGKRSDPAAEQLRQRIQSRCDDLGLGVEITFLGFRDAHPPTEVVAAYESAGAATHLAEADVFAAEAEAARTVPETRGEAVAIIDRAKAAGHERRVTAAAEAARFTDQLAVLQAAPKVFRWRHRIDAVTRVLAGRRKTVIAADASHDTAIIDLREKPRPGLLDMPLEEPGNE